MGMKLDDDTQAVVLLSFLPDSWSGFVTTVTETAGTGNLKFDRVRDSVLVKTFAGGTLVGDLLLVCSVLAGEEVKTEAVGVVGKACLKLGRM